MEYFKLKKHKSKPYYFDNNYYITLSSYEALEKLYDTEVSRADRYKLKFREEQVKTTEAEALNKELLEELERLRKEKAAKRLFSINSFD